MRQTCLNLDQNWIKYEKETKHIIRTVQTTPFSNQRSLKNFPQEGLHRPQADFTAANFTENFIQSALNVQVNERNEILVGGTGSKLSNEILLKIVKVAAGNCISTVHVGLLGVISRPAMAHLAAKFGCWGFLVHYAWNRLPNYEDQNLAIDLIAPNGGPINPYVMDEILWGTQLIVQYNIVPTIAFNLCKTTSRQFKTSNWVTNVDVIDSVAAYVHLMEDLFDFDEICRLVTGKNYMRPFDILIDCSSGAISSYVCEIFLNKLGGSKGCVINCEPIDETRTFHPSYVDVRLIEKMKAHNIDLGVLMNGDGSRCLLFGVNGFHIPVGETISVIMSHPTALACFMKSELNGVGRCFSTSSSVDVKAQTKSMNLIKTPNSWIYFNRLIKQNVIDLCEDEHHGVGSRHVTTSDGIWAVLAWLTLALHLYKPVSSIMIDYWVKYGRYFMTIYEYHHVPYSILTNVLYRLKYNIIASHGFIGSKYTVNSETYKVLNAGNFPYCFEFEDEITYEDMRLKIDFEPESILIFRSIVSGSEGTFRIVAETYNNTVHYCEKNESVTSNLFQLALLLSRINDETTKYTPDIIY